MAAPARGALHLEMSEFWSGDLGLTLISISLITLIFVILPLHQAGLPGRFLFDMVMLALMISGAMTQRHRPILAKVVIAVVIADAIAIWVSYLYPLVHLQRLSSFLSMIGLLLYAWIVLVVMFRAGPVTWSRMQGGVSAYLLIGLAWGAAYRLAEQIHPGSFHFVTESQTVDELTARLDYFSFSTLTTVGFGDVTALSPAARSLAIGEAVVGQLFPAILIGALVAMAMQPRPTKP